jgi:hypothetical protein
VSNGYLVVTPDIVYTTGHPGQSALKCVLPAVDALLAKGYVDRDRIGIQGHSWGGYQIAYMITQTNIFKAAEAGAPVVNMIAAYDGIRWGSGLPRQFQYEKTQSRIGGTPWQYPLRFIEMTRCHGTKGWNSSFHCAAWAKKSICSTTTENLTGFANVPRRRIMQSACSNTSTTS